MIANTSANFWTRVGSIASQYENRPVVVLGKGASADDVDPRALEGAFVIGINDAARVAHANVTVFHEDWVWAQLPKQNADSSLYLSSALVDQPPENFFAATFEPLTQENSELMLQRLFTDSLVVEEVMFLSALRVAMRAVQTTLTAEVYFVGFDFSTERGFSKHINPNASGATQSRQRHRIESQERIFTSIRHLLAQRGIRLLHVGYRTFSDLTPGAFSERVLNFHPQPIHGSRSSLLVTAELTTNHLGDVERAKMMMCLAAEQGADFVKFQMRDVDTFYRSEVLESPYPSPFGTTFRDYRKGLELSDENFHEVDALATTLGIGWFASVLDVPSLERAIALELPIIKLPGTISRKRGFLTEVAERFTGDLVLSTGMSSQEYIDWLLQVFGNERTIYLLHANSAYPTPIEDCNISIVSMYSRLAAEHPHIVPGYSSHDDGWFGSALAVACGARMLEKHVKLGSNDWVHFDNVALDLSGTDFSDYVQAVRRAEVATGVPEKRVTPSEHHKY